MRNEGSKGRKMDWRAISHEACFKFIDDTGIRFTAIKRRVSNGMATVSEESKITRLEAVSGVVRGALRGALAPGRDPLMGAKAIVLGVIWGSGVRHAAALKILAHTTRTMIRQTSVRNGDVGSVVTGIVRGAIIGSPRMGVSTASAALAVVTVAIEEFTASPPWMLRFGRN